MLLEFFPVRIRILRNLPFMRWKKNGKVLDIGSGSNPYYHKKIKGEFVTLDINGKSDIVADAGFLPFRANSFDKVFCVNSLYYFRNPFDVVGEIARVLMRNGDLFMVVPFFYPIHDVPSDRYRFTEYGLRTLLEGKFRIKKLMPIGGIFTLPSVMFHSLIKGFPLIFPKLLRKPMRIVAYVLWPFYLISQFLSILDFLDRTRRVPTYYLVMASRK